MYLYIGTVPTGSYLSVSLTCFSVGGTVWYQYVPIVRYLGRWYRYLLTEDTVRHGRYIYSKAVRYVYRYTATCKLRHSLDRSLFLFTNIINHNSFVIDSEAARRGWLCFHLRSPRYGNRYRVRSQEIPWYVPYLLSLSRSLFLQLLIPEDTVFRILIRIRLDPDPARQI